MSDAAESNPRSEYQPILITGTTGFVGMEVMARFLQRSRRHLFALIRAPNDADAHQRLRAVLAIAFGDADAYSGRVTAVAGDIERPGLGLDPRRLADDDAGARDLHRQAFNVLYGPIRAASTGAYRALPLNRRALLDVVPIDYVADALFELCSAGPNGTFHLVAGDRAPTTGHVARMTAERFDQPRPWIVPPAVYRALYPLLRRAVRGRQRLALEHTQVFIPYLNIGVRFQDHLTRARLEPAGVRLLPFDDYFARLLDFALAADWGKRPFPHPRSAAHAASDQHPAPARPPTASQPGKARDAAIATPEPAATRRGTPPGRR